MKMLKWIYRTLNARMWATCPRALNHSCWLSEANSFDVLIEAPTVRAGTAFPPNGCRGSIARRGPELKYD